VCVSDDVDITVTDSEEGLGRHGENDVEHIRRECFDDFNLANGLHLRKGAHQSIFHFNIRPVFYLNIGPKTDNHCFLQDSGSHKFCSKDGHCDGTIDPETKSDFLLVSIITPTRQKTQNRHSLLYDCFQYQTYPNK
jgi:hypothetical protein